MAAQKEKKVRLYVDPTPGDSDPNMVIGVNGVMYVLPKMKYSEVPESVAYEYERSRQAARLRDSNAANIIAENRRKEEESKANA